MSMNFYTGIDARFYETRFLKISNYLTKVVGVDASNAAAFRWIVDKFYGELSEEYKKANIEPLRERRYKRKKPKQEVEA